MTSAVIPFWWELLDQDERTVKRATWRAKIHGGWMVLFKDSEHAAMSFVPDPKHLWRVKP